MAQDISGPARAADGDSLDLSGISVRLYGIDAPELAQSCQRNSSTWMCGKEAQGRLASLIAGRQVVCDQKDVDDYGRIVAACRAGTTDLGGAMIDAGLAVALPHFSDRYIGAEARARTARLGLWAGSFQTPAEYRAANPRPRPRAINAPRVNSPTHLPSPSGVFFRNCKEAWAVGAAPLRRGQPGYRSEMDGDGDGIACEPYRGR
ncbi:thermonuclease family protein [Sphingopyxis sp.]|uniref:thermonuclease family protein n=1 Tax=Sphingopyxis sp. TaxID=1908224 RepID=UPI003D812028